MVISDNLPLDVLRFLLFQITNAETDVLITKEIDRTRPESGHQTTFPCLSLFFRPSFSKSAFFFQHFFSFCSCDLLTIDHWTRFISFFVFVWFFDSTLHNFLLLATVYVPTNQPSFFFVVNNFRFPLISDLIKINQECLQMHLQLYNRKINNRVQFV